MFEEYIRTETDIKDEEFIRYILTYMNNIDRFTKYIKIFTYQMVKK